MCAENLNQTVCSIKEKTEHTSLAVFHVRKQLELTLKKEEVTNEENKFRTYSY